MYIHKSLKLAILALFITTLIIFSGCIGVTPPINHPPTIISLTANPQSPIEVNQSTVITCLATDQDGYTLTYTWTKTGGTITGSGLTIAWTAPAIVGTYTITCTVSDGESIDIQSITIVVLEPEPTPNRAPVITSAAITSGKVGVAYTYDVDATDPDGDPLTYSLTTSPAGMTINSSTGLISWTPTSTGDYDVTVEVSDNGSPVKSTTQSFTITVISSSEVKAFLGEWTAINPTRMSKVKIHSFGNKIIVHEWKRGNTEHPEDYDWGEQVVEIPGSFNGTFELNWTIYSDWSCNQKIGMLANGVLKVFSTENYYAYDVITTYTDYFYNPEDENSYIPSLPGVGLYQNDPEFINLVKTLDSPKKIVKYMEDKFNYKVLWGPHSPYQTYLSKEGDCGDHAVFACVIANFHGYECFYIMMHWTCGGCHAITVYNMGGYYTYSNNWKYFGQRFNSIEECVNHCASTYIEYNLSSHEVYNWDFYHYRHKNNIKHTRGCIFLKNALVK